MPGGRNSYSEEDDALLVEYLAESGTSEGRKGKNVYQRLVENTEGRWPWSSRHPWQSWRSHYIKDEELFDLSTSDNSKKEETNAEPLRKRKTSPVVESKREQKRRKVQDVPVKKVDGSPSKGPAPSRKQTAPLAYNGFVPVSQLFRRNQPVSDDKGEGSSRDGARAQSNSTKAAPSTARTTYPTRLP
ncbi:hypothetical protein BT96DRAFT_527443 [Gymnopus androsaceus JB14]|uniref:TERF2-interacting telomeric protein 1 Myb domain-containing protein n=1 Tax=Gymnopus androsaceus JB14 TaxID=1447944 RepID=A0A6A4IJZ5_9AGAR|nr:hypothetical protein BT96DRAFT_527443 [Gymnopus androsaceus JB14]